MIGEFKIKVIHAKMVEQPSKLGPRWFDSAIGVALFSRGKYEQSAVEKSTLRYLNAI